MPATIGILRVDLYLPTRSGSGSTAQFAMGGRAKIRQAVFQCRSYVYTSTLKLNHWALSGDWTATKQFALLNSHNGRMAYCFRARDLHLIMGLSAAGTAVNFRVMIDGQPPEVAHGGHVDAEGKVIVTQQRLPVDSSTAADCRSPSSFGWMGAEIRSLSRVFPRARTRCCFNWRMPTTTLSTKPQFHL